VLVLYFSHFRRCRVIPVLVYVPEIPWKPEVEYRLLFYREPVPRPYRMVSLCQCSDVCVCFFRRYYVFSCISLYIRLHAGNTVKTGNRTPVTDFSRASALSLSTGVATSAHSHPFLVLSWFSGNSGNSGNFGSFIHRIDPTQQGFSRHAQKPATGLQLNKIRTKLGIVSPKSSFVELSQIVRSECNQNEDYVNCNTAAD